MLFEWNGAIILTSYWNGMKSKHITINTYMILTGMESQSGIHIILTGMKSQEYCLFPLLPIGPHLLGTGITGGGGGGSSAGSGGGGGGWTAGGGGGGCWAACGGG
uniref:Uncharacterized protein n=1 Tax=Lactuca sativa TaxID=4236 RepID=A0A9R1X1Y2_LACSA|nr:hypothetical protein LSAT_V11C800453260 [Lactuca sativa]